MAKVEERLDQLIKRFDENKKDDNKKFDAIIGELKDMRSTTVTRTELFKYAGIVSAVASGVYVLVTAFLIQ